MRITVKDAKLVPFREYKTDAGWDLRSGRKDIVIKSGAKVKIPTGVCLELREGVAAMVVPRSGLGTKFEINLANTVGIIDSDYRGEIFVFIKNNGTKEYELKQYERFCQLIIFPIYSGELSIVAEINKSNRGSDGFGSTGVK